METEQCCSICPRGCVTARGKGQRGFCGATQMVRVARVAAHLWEEPPISGERGSGTVFFSYCNLRCVFCQNMPISRGGRGQELSVSELAELFLRIEAAHLHNVNLVSPTQYLPQIREALILAKTQGLKIPVVYNSNGYESVASLQTLEGLIDVYLPDLKYFDEALAIKYSVAPGYFVCASQAIMEMQRQVPEFKSENGLLQKGLIVRHLILPGCSADSMRLLDWVRAELGTEAHLSLLRQYTPMYDALQVKELNRRLTSLEYERVVRHFWNIGLKHGFTQEKSAASAAFTPDFARIEIKV